jgi:osmotically-inducible protein OsmY
MITQSAGGGYAVELWLSDDYAAGLKRTVERELSAELESARARGRTMLMVEVHDGFATLTGQVRSWAEKAAARRAVMRVPGVTEIEDRGVEVRPDAAEFRSDAELVHMARAVLNGDSRVTPGAVRVDVADGRITLTGVVDHEDERAAAVDAVAPLVGVREVTSQIVVPPRAHPLLARARLKEELERVLGREAKHIRIGLGETGST